MKDFVKLMLEYKDRYLFHKKVPDQYYDFIKATAALEKGLFIKEAESYYKNVVVANN